MMQRTYLIRSIVLLFLLLGLAACKNSETNNLSVSTQADGQATPARALTLRYTEGCTTYRQYLADSFLEDLLNRRFNSFLFSGDSGGEFLGSTNTSNEDALTTGTSSTPTYVSQTNTQEQGVDEADIVKAGKDGLLYQLRYGVLYILQGAPVTAMGHLGSLDLDLGDGGAVMYLDDTKKRIVVIGNKYQPAATAEAVQADSASIAISPNYGNPTLQVFFIDVANPVAPVITRQLSIEGSMISSRRIGDRIHLVSSFRLYLWFALQSEPAFNDLLMRYWQLKSESESSQELKELVAEIKSKVDSAIQEADITELLPASEWVNADQREDAALLECGGVMYPDVKLTPSLLTITSIDIDGANAAATAIMNNARQVYASQERLYVAQGSGSRWGGGWWWHPDQRQQTAIYQFNIGAGAPVYTATGLVDGRVKDAYSFSDYAGHLRLVTTHDARDVVTNLAVAEHTLRVLRDNGAGELQQISSVQGFGRGERVFAVRFTGDQGYVVTFRQIDPLFTFDLGDPKKPRLMGELEIPGFSTYMHPLGKNHLLTIGRNGNAWGATNGIQLQIFDVSDLTAPRKIHSYEPNAGVSGYSWSTASYDPHAFTFYAEEGLLAIPMSVWDAVQGQRFNGIVVLSVDVDAGIDELGRVDHSDLAYELYCSDTLASDDWRYFYCQQGGAGWWSSPRRSVFMTDTTDSYLFSLSDVGVKATLAQQPDVVLGSEVYQMRGTVNAN